MLFVQVHAQSVPHAPASYNCREHVPACYNCREHVPACYNCREHVPASYNCQENSGSSFFLKKRGTSEMSSMGHRKNLHVADTSL